MKAAAAQRALALSLLELPLDRAEECDEAEPPFADLLARHVYPVAEIRMPLRCFSRPGKNHCQEKSEEKIKKMLTAAAMDQPTGIQVGRQEGENKDRRNQRRPHPRAEHAVGIALQAAGAHTCHLYLELQLAGDRNSEHAVVGKASMALGDHPTSCCRAGLLARRGFVFEPA